MGPPAPRPDVGFARLAGSMFLFVIAMDLLAMYATGAAQGSGTFADKSRLVGANEGLYRVGLAVQLVACVSTLLLALGLYALVRPIDPRLAVFALSFRVIEVATSVLLLVVGFGKLSLYLTAGPSGGIDAAQA